MLAFAAAAQAAAAGDRFVPADASFVVARIASSVPDAALRPLVQAWQENRDEADGIALAEALLQRAHALREPAYVGRAEAVLEPFAARSAGSPVARRLYAQALQHRHDFDGALRILDEVLREHSRDAEARTLRATVRLVRGDFAGARADCAQLIVLGGVQGRIGLACLAEALAGIGELDRALALLATLPDGDTTADSYLLAVRAELLERDGREADAIAHYRRALALDPGDDSIRAALADALAAQGEVPEAFALLETERPSLALRVRRAALAPGDRRAGLAADAAAWLALEAARGDSIHGREGALLALMNGDAVAALAAARANFARQRELPDVRVLARAAVAAGDTPALQWLREWLVTTGYRDVVTARILADATRG